MKLTPNHSGTVEYKNRVKKGRVKRELAKKTQVKLRRKNRQGKK